MNEGMTWLAQQLRWERELDTMRRAHHARLVREARRAQAEAQVSASVTTAPATASAPARRPKARRLSGAPEAA
jgi:hypothetical protein